VRGQHALHSLKGAAVDHLPLSTVIVQIIRHTPLWVWGILAAITLLGARQMRDHETSRVRLLVAALGLGGYSLWGAIAVFGINAAATWLAGMALAFALNHKLQWPRTVTVVGNGRFALPGGPWPLLLMWTIFMLRYALAVKLVFQPSLAQQAAWAIGAPLVYGTLSGLFAARAWRVLQSARTDVDPLLAPLAPDRLTVRTR
jgi:hypothetical protein